MNSSLRFKKWTLVTTIIDIIFVCTIGISLLLTLLNVCTCTISSCSLFSVSSCLSHLSKFFCHNTLKLRGFVLSSSYPFLFFIFLSLFCYPMLVSTTFLLVHQKERVYKDAITKSWNTINSGRYLMNKTLIYWKKKSGFSLIHIWFNFIT